MIVPYLNIAGHDATRLPDGYTDEESPLALSIICRRLRQRRRCYPNQYFSNSNLLPVLEKGKARARAKHAATVPLILAGPPPSLGSLHIVL